MADQVAVMQGGRLEQIAPAAEIYRKPINRFVAGFIGASNFLPARIEQRYPDGGARLVTPSGLLLEAAQCDVPGERAVVTVRPEAISLQPAGAEPGANRVAAQVTQVVYRGYMLHYSLRLADGAEMIVWRQTQGEGAEQVYPVGAQVGLCWQAQSNHVIADA